MMDDKQLTEEYLDGKVVFPGKIIRVEHWHVRLPNGETALREVACHPGAAGIVALDDDGNVILVRQHRIAVGRLTLEIPAGKLDGVDEDPFVCAQRELSEETGASCETLTPLGEILASPGGFTEVLHLYMATGLTFGSQHPDEDEFISFERVPFDALLDRCLSGELRDGKTVAGVLKVYALRTRKKEEK